MFFQEVVRPHYCVISRVTLNPPIAISRFIVLPRPLRFPYPTAESPLDPKHPTPGGRRGSFPFFPDKTKYQKGGAPSRVHNINSMIHASYDARETGNVEKSQGFQKVTYKSTLRAEGRGWGGRASIHTFWRLEFPIVHSYKLQAL